MFATLNHLMTECVLEDMTKPIDSKEITSIKIDDHIKYLYKCENDDQATWKLVLQAQQESYLDEDECNHKYKLPEPKEFQSFASNIYKNFENIDAKNKTVESVWRLLYRVQGTVFFKKLQGYFAELYFNTENHYLLIVIKGTSSKGNYISCAKNVFFGSNSGEPNTAFTFGEKVRMLMNEFKCKPMLLITGHSLGGYLAQIITYTITYCFVDDGKVMSRKEPMDDFGIYTVVFDSPAALEQISSIAQRDPIELERYRLPITNFIVDVNIINCNPIVGHHAGQVISVGDFKNLNKPTFFRKINDVRKTHGIDKIEIDKSKFQKVEYLPKKISVKYNEKEIQCCFFSSKNFERLHKYIFFSAMNMKLVNKLPNFNIFCSKIILQEVSPEEFIPRAYHFLSQCKKDLDADDFAEKDYTVNAIYKSWTEIILKDARPFFLNEELIDKVKHWKDGTKIGGFESYEEMCFVGCILQNSIQSCCSCDYEQRIIDQFKATNEVTLILIVKDKNQKISHRRSGNNVKIVYLLLDSVSDEEIAFNLSALDGKSQEKLKNTQLQFMGNEVSALEIFGNELVKTLTIWNIYSFKTEAVQPFSHFYVDQDISGELKSFKSATEFARELMKREQRFVSISSDAGMGKSTALGQIALTLQQELQNNWIVHINLFSIQTELSSAKDTLTSTKAAIEFVRNMELKDRKSDKAVLAKVFDWKLQETEICILFDSLDEVCPMHRETVEKFIALLRETQRLIVLTTRPHEGKNFENANLFNLKPLNQQQRRNYINKKFETSGKSPPTDFEVWLDNISGNDDFWSLPLNLNMATSMYTADADNNKKPSGFKGKTNIYEWFLTQSIDSTIQKKFNIDKNLASMNDTYREMIDEYQILFENLAVCLIFHGGEIKKLESKDDTKEKIKKKGKSINRFDVAQLDNNYEFVSFLHRSYAEYLVARVFVHQKYDKLNTFKLSNDQLRRIYLEATFTEVRVYICGILAASPTNENISVPFFTGMTNERELLGRLIEDDCYELFLQLKIKFKHCYQISDEEFLPLFLALQRARSEFVQELIKEGAKFEDILNRDGVLHLALTKGLHQEVKNHFEGLKSQIHIEHRFKLPLHFAAEFAGRDLVAFLIDEGAQVDAKGGISKTALFLAIEANNADVCKLLIEKGADYTEALNYSVEFGGKETFNVIYKNTPDEHKVVCVKKSHFEAVEHGNLEMFEHICGLPEANPFASDADGYTFLHRAAGRGHLHCMPFILEYMNQEVDIPASNNQTALMYAFWYGQEEVIQWLLGQKADIRKVDECISYLHNAARDGNEKVLNLCLDAGAGVNSQDEFGKTALFHAVRWSQKLAVKYLLEKGGDPEIIDNDGNTCLHAACKFNSFECAKLLVAYQPPLNRTNRKGETPLHLAALKGNEEMVAFLLEEAKKQKREPVDSETIIRLTERIKELDIWSSNSCKDVKNEILKWKYIIKQ